MAKWARCVQCQPWNESNFVCFSVATTWRRVTLEGDSGYVLSSEKKSEEQRLSSRAHFVEWTATLFMLGEHVPTKRHHFPSVVDCLSWDEVQQSRLHPILIKFKEGQWFEQNHSPSYLNQDRMLVGRIEHLRMPMESVPDFIDVCKVAFTRPTIISLSYTVW